MINNVFKTENGYECVKCSNVVKDTDNFCSNCGNSLSVDAQKLREEQNLSIKLQAVKKIVEITKDPRIIEYLNTLKK